MSFSLIYCFNVETSVFNSTTYCLSSFKQLCSFFLYLGTYASQLLQRTVMFGHSVRWIFSCLFSIIFPEAQYIGHWVLIKSHFFIMCPWKSRYLMFDPFAHLLGQLNFRFSKISLTFLCDFFILLLLLQQGQS